MTKFILAVALLAAGVLAAQKADAQSTGQGFVNDRMALWNIIVPNCLAKPANCTEVKPNKAEYVITKPDARGQYLLIPTILMSGVEAYYQRPPRVAPYFLPNYWVDAARAAIQYLHPLAGQWIAVAMNSANTRSQDQLHLHLCELRQDVAQTIAAAAGQIVQSDVWQSALLLLTTGRYRIRKSSNLRTYPPFQYAFQPDGGRLAADPKIKAGVNLLLAIAPNKRDYYLLYNTDGGAAEALLAQKCS